MTSLLPHYSVSTRSLSPYHVHDQFYTAMFPHHSKNTYEKDQESFMGATMQSSSALVQQKSRSKPITSNDGDERQPRATKRPSLDSSKRSINSAITVKAGPSRQRNQTARKHMSQGEIQIQQLYLEARRHEAATARVTKLEDFRSMSFTLPAAKTVPPQSSHDRAKSPTKHCLLIPAVTGTRSPPTGGKQRRKNGPMFRGRKSWTSSAAAGSFVAEADQADQYYQRSPNSALPRKKASDAFFVGPAPLDHIEEEKAEEQAEDKPKVLSWKSLLPKKWISPRSFVVEI